MRETGYGKKSLIYAAKSLIVLITLFLFSFSIKGQETYVPAEGVAKKPVLWERVDIGQRDLFDGPGGSRMRPALDRVEFIEEEKGGSSKKYRIRDARGREWVAKIDKESQPETVSVRLLWGLGYKTEINYLAPTINIPGKGTFQNVRLEARPSDVERVGRWKWKENPFSGTKEFKGLKVMMAFLNNWDLKDGNTMILDNGRDLEYVVSDLGATFGNYGSNNFPVIWRIGRSINKPLHYSKSKFIDEVEDGVVDFAYKGKRNEIFRDITVNEARWITELLLQLSDKQIRDAFRAANYTPNEINILTRAVKNRILELDRATRSSLAK